MLYDNFAMLTKRELLIRIVKLLKEDELITKVKYIPVEMRPRNKRPIRCCVHKDRYILKHKIISILGFEITDEEIDLIHLSDFARMAMANKNMKENILSVVHEACSACIQSQYAVTNLCRGCEGRPCVMNCPKNAISFIGGKASISSVDCVSCGLCQKVCPYHAIVFTPVPCEALRGRLPGQSHQQGRRRRGAHRQKQVHLLREVHAGMPLRRHHGAFQNHRHTQEPQ